VCKRENVYIVCDWWIRQIAYREKKKVNMAKKEGFSNLRPVKVLWNNSQTNDFTPVNSYLAVA